MDWNLLSGEITDNLTNVDIIVIGYVSCPYSLKALKLISENEQYANRFKFISFGSNTQCFRTPNAFRLKMNNYTGTFPVIFIRTAENKFKYIGGAQELETLFTQWTSNDAHW